MCATAICTREHVHSKYMPIHYTAISHSSTKYVILDCAFVSMGWFSNGALFVLVWWGVHSGASHRMSCPLQFPSSLLRRGAPRRLSARKSPLQLQTPPGRGGFWPCVHHCRRGKPHPSNKVKYLPVWIRWQWRRGRGIMGGVAKGWESHCDPAEGGC